MSYHGLGAPRGAWRYNYPGVTNSHGPRVNRPRPPLRGRLGTGLRYHPIRPVWAGYAHAPRAVDSWTIVAVGPGISVHEAVYGQNAAVALYRNIIKLAPIGTSASLYRVAAGQGLYGAGPALWCRAFREADGHWNSTHCELSIARAVFD